MYAKSSLLLRGGGATRSKESFSILWKRKGSFMLQTFALLIIQLVVTFLIMHQLGKSEKFAAIVEKYKVMFMISILLITLALIAVLSFVPMPMSLKLVLFTLFSLLFGVLLAYAKRHVPPAILRVALIGALSIFVIMFVIGLGLSALGFDLSWMSVVLMVALIVAVVSGLVMMFIDVSQRALRIRAALVVFLFMLFILYDTNQILRRDYYGDIVTAAMDYYLDVINIFVNLITSLSNGE